jgi:hypothetical protein
VTGATIQCLSHSANPAIELGAAGWIPTSIDLLTRQVLLYVGHSSKFCGAGTEPRTAVGPLPCACSSRGAIPAQNFFTTIWRRWGKSHSRLSSLQADALLSWLHRLVTDLLTWSGRRDSNPRSRRWQRRVLATRRLPLPTKSWSEQRELDSRHRVGSPRHQPLYHARSEHLAGVTGFEPAVLVLETSALPVGSSPLSRSQRELNPFLLTDSQVSCR